MASQQDYAYEALCSAFYNMPFAEFLGESDELDGSTMAWFHLGTKPKDMRVRVIKHRVGNAEQVSVRTEWHTPTGKMQQDGAVMCWGPAPQVHEAVEAAVLSVLNRFKEVSA